MLLGEYLLRDGYSECVAEVGAERAGLLALDGELPCPAAEDAAQLRGASAPRRAVRDKALVFLRGRSNYGVWDFFVVFFFSFAFLYIYF